MSDQASRIKQIFNQVLELEPAADRAALLDEACGGDADLRARVQLLLDAYEEAGSFLESPPAGLRPPPGVAAETLDQEHEVSPGVMVGPYKLLQQIGEGGFGVVYMAEQLEPMRRKVALKIIKPGMDSRQVVARFEAERQALALMDHPNIAKVFAGGVTKSGRPYFVMELVKGVPLIQFCDENRIDTQRRLMLFGEVCSAIQHAHQKGVIHRDIKPSNVMVTMHDGEPVPKVIDFGIAKAISLELTEKTMFTAYGQMIGTPQYMSPEQAELSGLDIDTRSDIYSLGVLLYELLTGSTPLEIGVLRGKAFAELQQMIKETNAPAPSVRFGSSTESAAIAAQRDVEPRKLSALLRGELDWIVLMALEKNRNRRYETASDLARDVDRYLRREPVQACPPTMAYRLGKTIQRHRAAIVVAGALLLTLIAGLAATLWQYAKAVEQREVAVAARQEALGARSRAERQSAQLEQSVDDLRRAKKVATTALADRSTALNRSEALRLAAQSSAVADHDPGLAVQLALESATRMPDLAAANNALLAGMGSCREVRTFRHRADAQVKDAIFSPDEKVLLGVEATRIGVWEAESGRLLRYIDPQHRIQNIRAKFSPDNRHIAVISRGSSTCLAPNGSRHGFSDRVVRIWDSRTGKEAAVLRGHGDRVSDVCFSPDGRRIASASWDGTVRLWNTLEAELIETFDFGISVACVAMTPDQETLVAAREQQAVSSMPLWTEFPPDSPMHPAVIDPPLDYESDGNTNVGSGHRYKPGGDEFPIIKAWSTKTGGLAREMADRRIDRAIEMQVLSNGDAAQLLLRSSSGVTLWDLSDGQLAAECDAVSWSSNKSLEWKAMSFEFKGERKRLLELSVDPRLAAEFITASRLSHDGKLAALMRGETISVRTTDGPSRAIELKGHHGENAVQSVAFSRDGRRLLSAGDNTLRLWDTSDAASSTHRVSVAMQPRGGESADVQARIHSLAFSPDGTMLATASQDKRARVFEAASGAAQLAELLGNKTVDARFPADRPFTAGGAHASRLRKNTLGEAHLARFSPDGSKVVVLSADPRSFLDPAEEGRLLEPLPFTPARVWDLSSQQLLWACPGNVYDVNKPDTRIHIGSYAWSFKSAVFTDDGQFLVTSDDEVDHHALLAADGSQRQSGRRSGITFQPGDSDKPVAPLFGLRCWDAESGELMRAIVAEVAGQPCYLSENGRRGLVPEPRGCRIVDPTTGQDVCRLSEVELRGIPPTFSPDNHWLVLASSGLHLWDVQEGKYVGELGGKARASAAREHGAPEPAMRDGADARTPDARRDYHTILPQLAEFTPDSKLLVTASSDGSAHVWDVPSGRHVAGYFGHTRKIMCLDVSPDGKWCATAGADRTAQIWSLRDGVELMTLSLQSEVTSITFDRDGRRLATAAAGIAQVWPLQLARLAEARAPRPLTSSERLRYEVGEPDRP